MLGRLQDNKASSLGKDEMLAMIRHGANEVFKSKDQEISDQDIDDLIMQGEQRVSFFTYCCRYITC